MKLTLWYHPYDKPVRTGWYETTNGATTQMLWWCDEEEMWRVTPSGFCLITQERFWRGLAEDPEDLEDPEANIDKEIGRYLDDENFFLVAGGGGDKWCVGKLKYVRDLHEHYSRPKYRKQLPLSAGIEGRGWSLYEAIKDAIMNEKVKS